MNFIKAQKEYIKIVANEAARPGTGRENVFYYAISEKTLSRWDDSLPTPGYVEIEFNYVVSTTGTDKVYGTDSSGNQIVYDIDDIGRTKFIDLEDTPTDYTGESGKLVMVNAAGDGLEFVSPSATISVVSGDAIDITTDTNGDFVVSVKVDDSTIEINSNNELQVKDGGISTAKLADDAVTTVKIVDDAVTEDKIADDAVTEEKIEDDAVTTSKINNGAVTNSKMADMPGNTIKGNNTGGSALPQDLSVADVKTMLGLSSAMRYMGSVVDMSALYTIVAPEQGDVYNVETDDADGTDGNNYAYNGGDSTQRSGWDRLGGYIDLSAYDTATIADGKYVAKDNSSNAKVYGTFGNGDETTYNIGSSSAEIPIRRSNGNIEVPQTPSVDSDAASKKYVDDTIDALNTDYLVIDLRDNNVLSIFTPVDIQIKSSTQINGTTGTLSGFSLNTTITADTEITFTATTDSVWKLEIEKQ